MSRVSRTPGPQATVPALDLQAEEPVPIELPPTRKEVGVGDKIDFLHGWLGAGVIKIRGQIFKGVTAERGDITDRISADLTRMYEFHEYQSWRSILRDWNNLELRASAVDGERPDARTAARLANDWLNQLFVEVDNKIRKQ